VVLQISPKAAELRSAADAKAASNDNTGASANT
jgi:hypothetical protein